MERGGATRRSFIRGGLTAAGSVGASSFVIAACGGGGKEPATAATTNSGAAATGVPGVDPASLGRKRIAYVAIFQGNENAGRIGEGIKQEAAKGGWTVDVVDGGGDVRKVQNQWQAILQRGVDGIVSVQIDTKTWGPQIAQAAAKRVPYVALFSNWRPGVDAVIGTNGGVDGAVLAQYVVDRCGARGKGIIISSRQFSSLDNRRRAFEAAIEPYPGIEVVENHELALPAYQQDALDSTQSYLAKYPKGELQWIYSSLDETGIAAAQACIAKGRDEIFVCASDGAKAGIKMIREGKPFRATTAPQFERVGVNAVRQLAQVMSGEPALGRVLYVDGTFVDEHNVGTDDYYQGAAVNDGNVFTYWRGEEAA